MNSALLAGLFYLLPFADLTNGFLLSRHVIGEGGLSSPSQLARMLVFCLLVTRMDRRQLGIVASLILLLLVPEGIGLFIHQSVYGLGIGFAYAFKVAYVTSVSIVLCDWVVEGTFRRGTLLEHALNGYLVYAANVVLALVFGFGEKTYGEENFGTKGFVASNNELSMTLGALLLLSATADRSRWNSVRSVLFMLGCLFVGAKASIVFCAAYLGILFWRSSTATKTLGFGLLVGVVAVWFDRISAIFSTIFDVIIFRYELSDGNLFRFLASGRDDYVVQAFGNIRTMELSGLRVFTGLGALVSFRDLQSLALLHPTVPDAPLVYESLETDLFDLFFQYGVFASAIYLAVIAFVAFRFLKRGRFILLVVWALVSGFSLVAGHVLLTGMSAAIVALLISQSLDPAVRTDVAPSTADSLPVGASAPLPSSSFPLDVGEHAPT